MKACLSCGERCPDRFRVCPICGTPLPATDSAQEERKLVTVLFCDLVGFTSRSEQMDIEDVRGTLSPYHRLLRRELERHGGTVEKFIGDAVMALFGALRARDDDAERAVLAALAIQDALAGLRASDAQLDLHVRTGVNTGEVVVRLDATPAAGEGMAFGDPVNVAARLQSAAPVDGVLVGEDTYQLTRDAIEFEPAEAVDAKGKRAPVKAWRAVAARERAEPTGVPLIGRGDELRRLLAALPGSSRSTPRVVAVTGEAGMGKSRLLHEFEARAVSHGGIGWHRATVSGIAAAPFGPFADILRSLTGIVAGDHPEAARSKLSHAAGVVADETSRAWVEREVGVLLGLVAAPAPGDRRVEAFAAWARLVADAAAARPLALVLDDVHQADDALLDLLLDLRRRLHGRPVLIVLALRAGAWERVESRSLVDERVALEPLSSADAAVLLHRSRGGARERVGQVLELAGGNPLFLREYARLMEDHAPTREAGRGESPVPIPRSIHAVIAARLDALPADDKLVVQGAAVLGERITSAALAACLEASASVIDPALARLGGRGVLAAAGDVTASSAHAYEFDHDLFRQVAYGTLTRSRRADLHLRAGNWIAQVAGGDRPDLVAHHYRSALELRRATRQPIDELAPKTQDACRAAGDAAYALNAFAAAADQYAFALQLARERAPDDEPRLLLALGKARYHAHDDYPEELSAAGARLQERGDVEGAAEAEMLTGFWLGNHGCMTEGLSHSNTARALLAGSPPSRLQAEIAISLGERAVLTGDTDEGERLCREALETATRLGVPEVRAQATLALAVARVMRGEADVLDELGDALRVIEAAHSPRAAIITMNAADVLRWLGDLSASFAAQLDGSRRAAELETPFLRRLTDAEGVRRAWYQGRWDAARAGADRLLSEIEQGKPFQLEVVLRIVRAHVRAQDGAVTEADRDLAEALEAARRSGDPETLVPALAAMARTAALQDAPERAAPLLGELADALDGGPRFLWGTALADVAVAAVGCRREARLRPLLERPPRTPWRAAALMILDHEFDGAAARYGDLGSAPDAGSVRRLAGIPQSLV